MRCSQAKADGTPCQAYALKGTDACLAHSDSETRASVGFVAEAGVLGGRPRRPREVELYAEVAEEMREEMRQVLRDGLRAELAVVVGGNSSSAHIETFPDAKQRLATLTAIVDRLHGKPRQMTEISGPDGRPVQVASTFDLSRLTVGEKRELLELLEKAA